MIEDNDVIIDDFRTLRCYDRGYRCYHRRPQNVKMISQKTSERKDVIIEDQRTLRCFDRG